MAPPALAARAVGITCPASNGLPTIVNGLTFNIRCGTDYYGGDLATVSTSSFADCVTSCATTKGCIDVAYTNGNCYLKNTLTSGVTNSNVWGAVLATAELAASLAPSCVNNKSNNAVYVATSGDLFSIQCSTDYYGGDLSSLWTSSFQTCLETCDTTAGCLGVAYSNSFCYLKSSLNVGSVNSGVWGAKKLTGITSTTTTKSTTTTAPATTSKASSSTATTTTTTTKAATTTTAK